MKKTVAVIFGGNSSEHEISLLSAGSVIKNISDDKYNVILLGITKDGRWFKYDGDVNLIPNGEWVNSANKTPAFISPDSKIHGIVVMENPIKTIYLDAVFPVLHGKNGEDGSIQGLFKLAEIPYVGCDTTSSAACMDKAITNALTDVAEINQAKWVSFTNFEYKKDAEKCIKKSEKNLGYPVFVKPASAGSSVGISKAHNNEELIKAIDIAFKEDKKVVIEENIDGYEVECAVLGNDEPIASVVGQIVPCNEFYDYEAKYSNPESKLHIPALISEEKRNEVAAEAVRAYKALGCEGLSRVDFFVTKADGKVLLNEINTIPGFTSISMYAKLFDASGIKYSELIDRLFELAIARDN